MLAQLSRFRVLAVSLLVLASMVMATPGEAASPVLDRVVKNGVLRVGMTVDQPPFNMRNRSKDIVGFDVDLARALAEKMQVELQIVELPFSELVDAVPGKKIDLAISGLTITPERTRKVSFVGPYTLSGKSILTTARIKAVVETGTDFNDPEIRIVALENSTSEVFVQRQLPEAAFHSIPNYNQGIEQLLTGEIDAIVADIPVLHLAMLRYPEAELGIIEPYLSVEALGIAIRKDDPQFENLLRNYLHAFDKSGLIPELRKKWFEDNSWIATLP